MKARRDVRHDWLRRIIVRTDSAGTVKFPTFPGVYGIAVHSSFARQMIDAAPRLTIQSGKTTTVRLTVR